MTTTTQWYLDMAKAIQARDHAISMADRWMAKSKDAELEIENLRGQVGNPPDAGNVSYDRAFEQAQELQ